MLQFKVISCQYPIAWEKEINNFLQKNVPVESTIKTHVTESMYTFVCFYYTLDDWKKIQYMEMQQSQMQENERKNIEEDNNQMKIDFDEKSKVLPEKKKKEPRKIHSDNE